jgi:lipopolysaccharide biosynthesis protein
MIVYFLIIIIVIIFFLLKKKEGFDNKKLCVIYNYYEKDENYKNNLQFFLDNGILEEVDYYFVINGNYSIEFPKKSNIKIYHRDNKGYDFGAYSYVIDKLKIYDYYIFMNTSVKGPYLKDESKWYNKFLPLFSENVHLVGTSINICTLPTICIDPKTEKTVNPHVQSMFFVVDKKYFNELKNENFFNENEINNMTFSELIRKKEVGLSEIAIKKGYNINCILSKYKNLNYNTMNEDINPTSINGDSYFKGKYFGETIDPYEVVFFKTNRDN